MKPRCIYEKEAFITPTEQKRAAKYFVARWESLPCVEEEHSRSFWIELLQDVLGVQNATHALEFERKVKGRKIDVFYEDMGILIEMKGRGISLDEATVRSKKAGPETPYQQAKWYADNLPNSIRPRWIITCNFDEFRIYDMEAADDQYVSLALEELPEQVHLLSFFSDRRNSRLVKEKELSVKAGELVGRLYAQLFAALLFTPAKSAASDTRIPSSMASRNSSTSSLLYMRTPIRAVAGPTFCPHPLPTYILLHLYCHIPNKP